MAITVKHNKVSTVADTSDTDLVRPSDWNADHTLTGFGTAAELDAGSPNGVATLDASGKVPTSQIPLQGDLNYQGAWNASTNTPTLASGTGTKGYYYVVSVAGTTNLDGITDWQVGDWAIFNGTVWQKVDNTDLVTSVNGYVGAVVLTQPDIAGTAASGANSDITSMSGLTGGITTPDYITFDTTPETVPTAAGSLYWDSADGNQTLSLVMTGGNAVQQIGEETYYRIKASSAITEGQVVMFTGSVGASGALQGAPATGLTAETASYIMGVATESIALNGWGYVTAFGLVRNIDTSAFTDGQILYYDPTVTGGLTATIPTAPNAKIQVCAVTHAAVNGSLFIRPTFGGKLGQYEGDVNISSPSSGNTLIYDAVQGRWENADISAGTGISISNGAGSVTVTNTAPDQTVSISAGTGISTSGTYPNFTVTNTAPDQVVSISGGGTTTVTGTYPNFTVSSDDQYDGTVTSVDLSAGTGISVSGGPITTSGSITVTNTAPDQVVAISGGTGISTSGTYPNFTVTNTAPDQVVAISAGTGISVSGTYPNFTVTNTSPDVPFTYTSTYVPYGQGTTTPDQSADFTYDESVKTLTAPQVRASNGIMVNSATVSADYSIPSGSNAMSAGPISIASGITVTVPSGNAWVIV